MDLPEIGSNSDLAEKQITISNALVRSGQALTLAEKRIVMLAVSKLDGKKLAPKESPTTRITVKEYAEEFDVDQDTAYIQLRKAGNQLMSRSLKFFEPSYKRNGKDSTVTEVNMQWVGEAHYAKNEGYIDLYWWWRLVPHLIGLKKQFTTYKLQQASSLRSIYSWRLLELLSRFQSTGWAEYSVEDFATSMDATEKQKENFNNIRRRIIEPAIKELTEKDSWIITYKTIKAGRRIKAIRFEFKRDPQGKLDFQQ